LTYQIINEIFFREKNPLLIIIPTYIWHGYKAIGQENLIVLNCPTSLYNYDNPDEYRLPFNTSEIDYDWGIKMG